MFNANPGRAFYDRQIQLLEVNAVDELIKTQYTSDAELIGYDLYVKGTEDLIEHFTAYLANLGGIHLVSTDKFMETHDSIMFEATVKVAAGIARVYDVFLFRDGLIFRHYTGLLGFTPNP